MRKPKAVVVYNTKGDMVAKYNSILEAAEHYNVRHPAMLYRIRTGIECNGLMFAFEDAEDETPLSDSFLKYRKKYVKDITLDASRYKIISYEVRLKRVSITPCPYKHHPKPMVGSSICQGCSAFRGINREAHQVACNHQIC